MVNQILYLTRNFHGQSLITQAIQALSSLRPSNCTVYDTESIITMQNNIYIYKIKTCFPITIATHDK